MESNLVQHRDRIESGKNTLNERPKRSEFLSTANLSSTTQRLQLHGHVTKRGRQKQKRRPGQATDCLQLHSGVGDKRNKERIALNATAPCNHWWLMSRKENRNNCQNQEIGEQNIIERRSLFSQKIYTM